MSCNHEFGHWMTKIGFVEEVICMGRNNDLGKTKVMHIRWYRKCEKCGTFEWVDGCKPEEAPQEAKAVELEFDAFLAAMEAVKEREMKRMKLQIEVNKLKRELEQKERGLLEFEKKEN